MARIILFQFKIYDSARKEMISSGRWGTLQAIQKLKIATPIIATAVTIDAALVPFDADGLTVPGFDPRAGHR